MLLLFPLVWLLLEISFFFQMKLIEHAICCPFEENWNGVSIGLDGELNFPSHGNGIYCYNNLPEKFNKEMYFVVALLPGVDCKRMEEIEASIFAFNCLPCDSLLLSNDIWVLRSASQLLPLFTF